LSPYFIDDFGSPPSEYPPGSQKDYDYHMKKVIPFFTFVTKLGNQTLFSLAYLVCFTDPTVFPLLRRSTGTGICNFIARFLTIFAPLVAELDAPIPIAVLLVLQIIALIVSFFFASESAKK